jgi:hypothetical protein
MGKSPKKSVRKTETKTSKAFSARAGRGADMKLAPRQQQAVREVAEYFGMSPQAALDGALTVLLPAMKEAAKEGHLIAMFDTKAQDVVRVYTMGDPAKPEEADYASFDAPGIKMGHA